MSVLDRITQKRGGLVQAGRTEQRLSFDQWLESFSFNGFPYSMFNGIGSTYQSNEYDEHSFSQYCQSIYKSNGVIFATVLARILLFTEAKFRWQRMREGRPGDLFGTRDLEVLDNPWPSGTTGELLARMEQDVSLSGNFYAVREGNRIRRLRPDWVQIILSAPPAYAVNSDVVGYIYTPGGAHTGQDRGSSEQKLYLPEEVAHWSPIPDPESLYRGMSWLTPVVNEVMADSAATKHKLQFFKNAATPGLSVSFPETITKAQFEGFMAAMNSSHQGTQNAYKTLYLGGGADVKVIGADLRQLDFRATQGAGETRICAAGGVPPIIVGLSEGLQSATYSNYGMARRKFGDHWARPQWRSACASLAKLVPVPTDARLWYDDRDIAFLREDQKDVAAIQSQQASTMKQLIDAGYKPESVVSAVTNEDWTLLEHTGLFSVQLQPPGAQAPAMGGPGSPPETTKKPDGPPIPEEPAEGQEGPPEASGEAKPDNQKE